MTDPHLALYEPRGNDLLHTYNIYMPAEHVVVGYCHRDHAVETILYFSVKLKSKYSYIVVKSSQLFI